MDDHNDSFCSSVGIVKEEFQDENSCEIKSEVKVKEELENETNIEIACESILTIKEEFKDVNWTNKVEEKTNLPKQLLSGENQSYTSLKNTSYGTVQFNLLAQNILKTEKLITELNNLFPECPLCGAIYKLEAWYEKHVKDCSKIIQDKSNQLLSCSICGALKKNEEALNKHMYYCKKKPTVQCNHCSYKTKTSASLRSHIYYTHCKSKTTKNTAHDTPKLLCAECGKYFASKKSLRSHKQNCNNKNLMDLYHCNHCPFKCKVKWYLFRHIYDRHFVNGKFETNDYGWLRSLECPMCRKTYKYQSSLTRHLTICGKEPGLQCSLCSYKCSKQIYLEIHIARQHPSKVCDSASARNLFHTNVSKIE